MTHTARARGRDAVRLAAIVARRDYLRTVRRRGFVLGTLALPLSIAGFFLLSSFVSGMAGGPGGPQAPTDHLLLVANESAVTLEASPATPNVVIVSREDGLERVREGTADELYVIPATYPTDARILRLEGAEAGTGPLAIGALQRHAAQQQELSVLLRLSVLAGTDLPPEVVQRVAVPIAAIEARGPGGQPVPSEPSLASFLVPFTFTMLFVLSIFITTGYLLQSVTEEKENRVVEIVLSSVPALPLMGGKIVGLGAAGLTQVAMWVLTALIAIPLLGDRLGDLSGIGISPLVLLLAVVYFALGYLAYGAMFSAVGALAPGSREAQQYAGIFGFAAVVPLIFAGLFLTDPGSPIVALLALIPLTTPATMLLLLTLSEGIPWLLVAASLLSLSAFAIVATIASARIFRATLLLYGVRPSVRAIVGAVFARG